jgi:hypothetical protein
VRRKGVRASLNVLCRVCGEPRFRSAYCLRCYIAHSTIYQKLLPRTTWRTRRRIRRRGEGDGRLSQPWQPGLSGVGTASAPTGSRRSFRRLENSKEVVSNGLRIRCGGSFSCFGGLRSPTRVESLGLSVTAPR